MIARLGRALVAVLAWLGAVLGVPAALVAAVGWPLPHRMPVGSDLLRRLGQGGVPDAFVLKALAVVVWLAWAELAVCLCAELAAAWRGRAASRVPLAGPLQPLARWLVAALVAAVAGLASPSPATAPLVAVLARAEPVVAVMPSPPVAPPTPAPPRASPERYVVVPGDNLWDIAEACLDGVEGSTGAAPVASRNTRVAGLVAELFDLNTGKEQPDGRWLRRPNLIRPGWVLDLPDGARVHVAPKPAPDPASAPAAPAQLSAPAPSSTPAPVMEATVPTTPTTSAADATQPPPSIPTAQATGDPPREVKVASAARRTGRSSDTAASRAVAGLLGVSGTGLAVGVARAVRRRRRGVLARADRGAVAAAAPPELDEVRVSLAMEADGDATGRLAGAMSEAAAHLVAIDALPRPRLVQVTRDGVEILLTGSALPAPAGWHPAASGAVWSRSRPAAQDDLVCPSPVLVTLGRTNDGATLHLDLEAEATLAIVGDAGVAGFARAAVLELAHSPLARVLAMVLVGDLPGLAPDVDRLQREDRWSDVMATIVAWAEQSQLALAANRWRTGLHARSSTLDNDAIAPLVVIATVPPTEEQLEVLAHLPTPSTVTIVSVGWEPLSSTRIVIQDEVLSVPSIGVSCAAQLVEVDTAETVGALLAYAASDEQFIAAEPTTPPEAQRLFVDGPYEDARHEVVVRVLGEVEVVGGGKPLTRLQTAVVSYIALHSPIAASRVEDAVWTAPTANRRKRLANTVSEARASLGAQHFPVASDGRYSVGPGVATDMQSLEHRMSYAAAQPSVAAIETLRGGLELVRGRPFTYPDGDRPCFVWVDLENWAVRAELLVIGAAERMGELCLAAGDYEQAAWAASRGLGASPAHTRLTELLMRAHAGAGDRHAANQVYENHVNALQALELDDVAESTLELHDELCCAQPIA